MVPTGENQKLWSRVFEGQILPAMKPTRLFGGAVAMALSFLPYSSLRAQTILEDNFESGAFSTAWSSTAGGTILTGSGAVGSARYVSIAATSAGPTARFDSLQPGGSAEFTVECSVRVQTTTDRQFNLILFTTTTAFNVRYQNGWAVFDGANWQSVPGLGALTPGAWHRFRLSGHDWGSSAARCDIELSDSGGSTFTSSVTGLTWFQSTTAKSSRASYFVFTTSFGNNPGFEVDEVLATDPTLEPVVPGPPPPPISGIYPHLSISTANQTESGIGAVVPWADRLYAINYFAAGYNVDGVQHLFEIDADLNMVPRGLPFYGGSIASRMIHDATNQLLIGPYFIDAARNIRQIPIGTGGGYTGVMPMHLSGVAKDVTDPNKVHFVGLAMGRGWADVSGNDAVIPASKAGLLTPLNTIQTTQFGFKSHHGKGIYTGQGRVIYVSNGNGGGSAKGGVLMEWDPVADTWQVVIRTPMDEVTGPGGIHGATNADDPVWALGWDENSALLMVRSPADGWHKYRLPKGSHTHDSYSGWYTEWPRIRDVGLASGQYLMNQHALLYRFPPNFDPTHTGGIVPVSNFLKMIVDYADFNGRIVMGCDDVSSFANPNYGRVHSNFTFLEKSAVDSYGGAAHGAGGVWLNQPVAAGTPSDPFLTNGFEKRVIHLAHNAGAAVGFTIEMDTAGDGQWQVYKTVEVPASGYAAVILPVDFPGQWIRFTLDQSVSSATAYLSFGNGARPFDETLTASLATPNPGTPLSQGVIRVTGASDYPLEFAADFLDASGQVAGTGYYRARVTPAKAAVLEKITDATAEATLRSAAATKQDFTVDAASVVLLEGAKRFRVPKGNAAFDAATASGWRRGIREVVTERSLMNIHGTFYELPRSDSAGMIRMRPVTTHNRQIFDFTSWRGLMVMTGNLTDAAAGEHVLVSDDGLAKLWVGSVDDLWEMGEPRGTGGPWKDTVVTAATPSDPYLMAGYGRKELNLSHAATGPVGFTVEVDVAGTGTWSTYGTFAVQPGEVFRHVFPEGYSAQWVRLTTDTAASVTAQFAYGPVETGDAFGQWLRDMGLPATQDPAVLAVADPDHDGLTTLAEHYLAGDPLDPASRPNPAAARVPAAGSDFLEIKFRRNRSASDVSAVLQTSPDLAPESWINRPELPLEVIPGESDTEAEMVRVAVPMDDQESGMFVRLRISR